MQIMTELYQKGYLSQKEIAKITHNTLLKIAKDNKKGIKFTFDDCRRKVQEFAKAKRKADRGRILQQLATIGYTGVFSAKDIAYTLLYTSGTDIAADRAMQEIADLENKYKENARAVPIIKRGIAQVLPKKWVAEIEYSAYNLSIRIKPSAQMRFGGVLVEGAGNIYAFLKMLLIMRPILTANHIAFTYDTLETIGGLWSMGESKIAYGSNGMSGKAMIESEKRSYRDYFADYNLPDDIKAQILDFLQESIAEVKYGVYCDSESGSYNSLEYKPIPEKGLWVGAGKAA